jgi:hypothetical protein
MHFLPKGKRNPFLGSSPLPSILLHTNVASYNMRKRGTTSRVDRERGAANSEGGREEHMLLWRRHT